MRLLRRGRRARRAAAARATAAAPARKKSRFSALMVRPLSHAQRFLDRFALGYTWAGGWHRPSGRSCGIYIRPVSGGGDDLARRTCLACLPRGRSASRCFPARRGCLHARHRQARGRWRDHHRRARPLPETRRGQTLTRATGGSGTVKVFEVERPGVPVFSDKHLSTRLARGA